MFRRTKNTRDIVQNGLNAEYVGLWRYALSLTGARDKADDLTQAAVLRALERHHLFTPGSNLVNWLFRITRNICISDLRREKVRTGNGLVGIDAVDLVDPNQNTYAHLQRKELLQAVLQLPEAQREPVILVYAEGFSYKDAAEILDIPVGTVMSRLAAARRTLSQKLVEAGGRHDSCAFYG